MNERLGRLEPVDLRRVWVSESEDFTPWMAEAENLSLLGEALGMRLELEAKEQEVGPFRADILCKEVGSGEWVLVENQLERTDHSHLGQLLTYAAGLGAKTIVWITPEFRDQHRAALDWLNENTVDGVRFFGIQVELWRVGDSPPAPRFHLISKPNDWTREVAGGKARIADGELFPTKLLQLEFWTGFREYAEESAKRFKPVKPRADTTMALAMGRSDMRLFGYASTWNSVKNSYGGGEIQAQVAMDDLDLFARLEEDRNSIEVEVGADLTWVSGPDRKTGRVHARKDADLEDRGRWPEYFAWLAERMDRLHEVFVRRVKALEDADQAAADGPRR